MVSTAEQNRPVAIEDYLQGELGSEIRHEYVGGQVYAMVGASDIHNLVCMNLATALHIHLRGSSCQVFIADMKVHLTIADEEVFYYPDVVVSCRKDDRARYFRQHPCLIAEITSKATARIDRREKFLAYQAIESLEEYVLAEQDAPNLTLFRRATGWQPEYLSLEDTLRIESLQFDISAAELYRGIDLQGE